MPTVGASGSESDEEALSDDEDVLGLERAGSIYAVSPHNPRNRRSERSSRTLALLIASSALEKCVLLTCVSSESLAALSITGAPPQPCLYDRARVPPAARTAARTATRTAAHSCAGAAPQPNRRHAAS